MKRAIPTLCLLITLAATGCGRPTKLPSIYLLPVALTDSLATAQSIDVRIRIFDAETNQLLHREVAQGLTPEGQHEIEVRLGFSARLPQEKLKGRRVRYEIAARTPVAGVGWTALFMSKPVEFLFEKHKTVWERILLDRWVILGLAGQFLFMMRFLIQWVVSERRRESTIPVAFWWCSVIGASIVLVYGLVQSEPIIILGQFGIIVYLRNLYLIYRKKAELAAAESDPPAD